MPDQTTPVTDDDRRKAREWAEKWTAANGMPEKNAAARVILATVPAPPRSLADELRAWGVRPFDGLNWTRFHDLADRAEAVERELAGHKRDYAECQQELIASERKCFSARAEVKRLTEQQKRLIDQRNEAQDLVYEARKERDEARTDVPPGMYELDRALPDPADVPANEAWEVTGPDGPAIGYRDDHESCPWSVVYKNGNGCDDLPDRAVTPVARLVSETDVPDRDHMNHLLEPASVPTSHPWLVRDDQGLCLGVRKAPGGPFPPWMLLRLCDGTMRRRADADVTMVRPVDISGLDINEVA
ncbi:hypothetical protein [Corynebacterium kalidii]